MLQLNHFMKQSMLFVLLVAFHREITLVNNALSVVKSSNSRSCWVVVEEPLHGQPRW